MAEARTKAAVPAVTTKQKAATTEKKNIEHKNALPQQQQNQMRTKFIKLQSRRRSSVVKKWPANEAYFPWVNIHLQNEPQTNSSKKKRNK